MLLELRSHGRDGLHHVRPAANLPKAQPQQRACADKHDYHLHGISHHHRRQAAEDGVNPNYKHSQPNCRLAGHAEYRVQENRRGPQHDSQHRQQESQPDDGLKKTHRRPVPSPEKFRQCAHAASPVERDKNKRNNHHRRHGAKPVEIGLSQSVFVGGSRARNHVDRPDVTDNDGHPDGPERE